MFETIITIFGYLSQITQVLGLRIYLLFSSFFLGFMSYFTFQDNLYANFIVRSIAALICLIGFFKWNVVIYRFKIFHLIPYALTLLVMTVIMIRYTNDPTPILDVIIAFMGMVGTFLMSVRSIFNWFFFFVLNCLEVILFTLSHDYQIVIMEAIFALSSIIGIIIWRYREIDKSREKGSFFKLKKI